MSILIKYISYFALIIINNIKNIVIVIACAILSVLSELQLFKFKIPLFYLRIFNKLLGSYTLIAIEFINSSINMVSMIIVILNRRKKLKIYYKYIGLKIKLLNTLKWIINLSILNQNNINLCNLNRKWSMTIYSVFNKIDGYFCEKDGGYGGTVEKADKSIHNYCRYVSYLSQRFCSSYLDMASSGVINLLEMLKDKFDSKYDKLAEYAILFLSYKLKQHSQHKSTNLNTVYTNHIKK
ncbi:hypothetical protein YYG_04049 [Plasmodium vinckei petteri]|uniref:Uncharacterized protein n=1 Tax=Plasmodium vinckei petteri TaxID=138298 RepID=W7AGQ3_PLAVN|nr:hypothetical protein YYG_04049 [Plasmodium vinckei petteri]